MIGESQLSLVIPSYNQGRYLRSCFESVFSQTLLPAEVIVMDGGSTDGSVEIIREYSDRLTYWQSEPDGGQAEAIGAGFARATGRYLSWLNSDDVLLADALSASVAAAATCTAGKVLVTGNILTIDKLGAITRAKRYPSNAGRWLQWGFLPVYQPGSVFSIDAYRTAGGLNTNLRYVFDTDLFIRMVASPDVEQIHLPQYLAGFRLHAASKTVGEAQPGRQEYERMTSAWAAVGFGRTSRVLPVTPQLAFRCAQLVSGRYGRMLVDTIRMRGLRIR